MKNNERIKIFELWNQLHGAVLQKFLSAFAILRFLLQIFSKHISFFFNLFLGPLRIENLISKDFRDFYHKGRDSLSWFLDKWVMIVDHNQAQGGEGDKKIEKQEAWIVSS